MALPAARFGARSPGPPAPRCGSCAAAPLSAAARGWCAGSLPSRGHRARGGLSLRAAGGTRGPAGGGGGGRASDEARVPRFPRGAALGAWNGRLIASLRLRPRVSARARCPGLRDPRGRAPPSPGPPERVRVGLGPGVLPSRGRGRRPCPRPLPGAASALPS